MSFRARVVASAALATASFLLAPSALAASHPVQVTGNQLKSALLPVSASAMLKFVNRVKKLR